MKEKIFVDNLQIGLDYAFFKEKDVLIYFNDKILEYSDKSFLFDVQYALEKEFDSLILNNLKVNNKSKVITSFVKLQEYAQKYNYIALEDDGLKYLFEDFGYIDYCLYKNSLEGIRWKKIFKIKNDVILSENLRDLEIFCDNKEWYNFVFPIIYKEDFNLQNLTHEELYFYFFKEKPIYIPIDINDEIFNKIYIKKCKKAKKIINKCLVSYINEPVLYIGNDSFDSFSECLCYMPNYIKINKFESKKIEIIISNKTEEQFYIDGKYSKIIANRLNLYSNQKKLYVEILKFVRNDLYLIIQKKEYGNWRKFLQNTLELLKINDKVEKIEKKFIEFLDQNDCSFEVKHNFDFYDNNKSIAIDIKLFPCSFLKIMSGFLKIREDVQEYFLISPDKIIKVDLEALQDIRYENLAKSMYDDLFYWYNYNIFVKSA